MGQIFNQPKYPVLDKAPGFWKTAGNFSLDDYKTWALATVASYPFGYLVGKNAGVGKQSAAMAAGIGTLAGFMLAYQGASGRLMGYLPNDREVDATLKN